MSTSTSATTYGVPPGGRIVSGPEVASRGTRKRSVRPSSVASVSAVPTRTREPAQKSPSRATRPPGPSLRGAISRVPGYVMRAVWAIARSIWIGCASASTVILPGATSPAAVSRIRTSTLTGPPAGMSGPGLKVAVTPVGRFLAASLIVPV